MIAFTTRPRDSKRGSIHLALLALFTTCAAAASPARAHFFWLSAQRDGGTPVVRGFLSETPEPDRAEFLKHIRQAKVTAGGSVLDWTQDDDTYRVAVPSSAPSVVDGACDLGVTSRGETTFRLLYTARAQFAPVVAGTPEEADGLRLRREITTDGKTLVRLRLRGKPVVGALVKAFSDEGEIVELKSDEKGTVPAADGAPLLAKWVEEAPGELDGKAYTEIRHYATLTVAPTDSKLAAETAPAAAPFAQLPEAVNSFGGAVAGDWLYVYSGHTADTHKYHRNATTQHFRRLSLKDRTTWEELPPGPALQGVALVAHQGKLYRIGGMSAHNAPGEPNDLRSVADFACYDPETKTWTDLTPLPAPRSTHDAVVAGDRIFVVGGWSMQGGGASNADFCEDALVFDLAHPENGWTTLPEPPFRRRALAVAEQGGKLYAIAGLTDEGTVSKNVDILDLASGVWSSGPELPGKSLNGFAPSAFGVNGRIYVSGHDGLVLRLNPAGDGWETVGKLEVPRLTHRLLPGIAGDLLAVGGTAARKPSRSIESVSISDAPAR